jgi:diguanylate cyclase (GGDEF)-like protein
LKTFVAELDRARRERRTVVVALIDLDFFKHVNDTYGHLAGDEALRLFSAAVGAAIRPYDHAGRYGGEEFLLILTEIPREIVEQRLSGLHAAISNLKVSLKDVKFTLNCSMGATVYDPTEHAGNVESLLAIADRALYAAKAEGRNRVVFYAPGVVGSQPRGSAAIISHS